MIYSSLVIPHKDFGLQKNRRVFLSFVILKNDCDLYAYFTIGGRTRRKTIGSGPSLLGCGTDIFSKIIAGW